MQNFTNFLYSMSRIFRFYYLSNDTKVVMIGSKLIEKLPSTYERSLNLSPVKSPLHPNTLSNTLILSAAMMGRRDSTSQEGSASSLDHSSDDSVIISRIRRSCEQKEEFLRRPAAPVWPATTAGGPLPGIKVSSCEIY